MKKYCHSDHEYSWFSHLVHEKHISVILSTERGSLCFMENKEKDRPSQKNEIIVQKSNTLISAKYKSTLLENKILSIALTRLDINGDNISASLYPGEIKMLVGDGSDSNIYRKLKRTAKVMGGHQIVIEDGKGNFKAFGMITNVDYEDKIFKITFNKDMRHFIPALADVANGFKIPFTTFNLGTLMCFDKNNSYRLYELLKKEVFRSNKHVNNGIVTKEYALNELRCMIGLVNMDEEGVKRAIARGATWDEIYEKVAIEKQYPEWRDFQRKVLKPAQEELAEKSDIKFDYECVRAGSGGRVVRLIFYISKNIMAKEVEQEVIDKAEKINKKRSGNAGQINLFDGLYKNIYSKYIGHNGLTEDDLNVLLSTAKYDEDKVMEAIEFADKQPNINNYMGWIISCIKNGYEMPVSVVEGSKEQAEKIEKISERKDDLDVQNRVWEKFKQKDDFKEFLKDSGLTEEMIELAYDNPRDRMELYTDWKTKRI